MNDQRRRERFLRYFAGQPLNANREALMRRTKLTKGRVSQLFDPNLPFGERAAKNLAEKLGLPTDFFTSEPYQSTDSGVAFVAEAHPVSYAQPETAPIREWEQLMQGDLPGAFRVHLPDDSMAPKAAAGTELAFSTTKEARPGSWVLIRDRRGNLYVRQYRSKHPGHWEAHAVNEAYQPLDAQADGLELVAVMTWAAIDRL